MEGRSFLSLSLSSHLDALFLFGGEKIGMTKFFPIEISIGSTSFCRQSEGERKGRRERDEP